jgi:hypothetical protein
MTKSKIYQSGNDLTNQVVSGDTKPTASISGDTINGESRLSDLLNGGLMHPLLDAIKKWRFSGRISNFYSNWNRR